MQQEQWLARYIESTFADVTLGNGIDLYAAQSMDDYGNPDEDRLSITAERHDGGECRAMTCFHDSGR